MAHCEYCDKLILRVGLCDNCSAQEEDNYALQIINNN